MILFPPAGYQAFIGFLKTESQHSHPVVLFFVHMMEIDVRRRRGQLEKVGLIVTTNQNLDHVISEEDTNIQLTHFDIGKGGYFLGFVFFSFYLCFSFLFSM